MLNLKSYADVDHHNMFTTAVSRKEDAVLRSRLEGISPEVLKCYKTYKEHFDKNQLELITPNLICKKNSVDLICLYEFKKKVIKDLKKKIDELQVNVISNTCQNCTINSVNTMDHILGKTQFPEYAVNPINLFPCCSECNGYKSKGLLQNGKRKFLNLYLDNLPMEQYLFVDIKRDLNNELEYIFKVENINNIDKDLFAIIKNHYDSLYLLKRMKTISIKYVSELINSINIRKNRLPIKVICEEVIATANENRKILGYNHFKYILEISLAQSSEFHKEF